MIQVLVPKKEMLQLLLSNQLIFIHIDMIVITLQRSESEICMYVLHWFIKTCL
jgi:hypothetical protein